jgi:hypothetical protein
MKMHTGKTTHIYVVIQSIEWSVLMFGLPVVLYRCNGLRERVQTSHGCVEKNVLMIVFL